MKSGDVLFGRRIRQNHALEHATITILSGMVADLRVGARSSSNGFIIFGDVDLGLLRRALDEALRRLQAGEAELAIHPNCGTNCGWRLTGDSWDDAGYGFQSYAYASGFGGGVFGGWFAGCASTWRVCTEICDNFA